MAAKADRRLADERGGDFMKFVKVDDTTIRCLITENEMEGYGIELEEFISDRQKAAEFLRMILDDAREETGFAINEAALSVEATMLPGKGLSLTISENAYPDDVVEKIRRFRDAVRDYLSFDEEDYGYVYEDEYAGTDHTFSKELIVLASHELQDFINLSKAIDVEGISSALYKVYEELYVISLRKEFTDDELKKVGAIGLEFAEEMYRDEVAMSYCLEHGKCIKKSGALEFLRDL